MSDTEDKAWVLRTCNADGTSHGGFKWPSEVGAIVECEDWRETPTCGNGLHGLLDGFGSAGLLSSEHDAVWQIVEVNRKDCIDLTGKVKFPICKIIYSGERVGAMVRISDYQIQMMVNSPEASFVDDSQLAASGYGSHLAASGYDSQLAASGYGSHLAASGDYSQLAASGNDSQLAAFGNDSQLAASGHGSHLAASGDYSQLAASGDYSRLAASGKYSHLAASGDYSRLAASGDYSQLAASGDDSRLTASGDDSMAIASGASCVAMAGEGGCIALAYWDSVNKRRRLKVGYVGEGLKPDTFYRINDEHEFEECR